MAKKKFDVFLSHSHTDAEWVEELAKNLQDQEKLNPWLDKWVISAGTSWQQAISKGLEEAKSCAVCLGTKTPAGWFQMEYEAALNRQANDPSFRVIPILLPGTDSKAVPLFLQLNDWVDFRSPDDFEYMFYRLACGIKGVAPGRWEPKKKKVK